MSTMLEFRPRSFKLPAIVEKVTRDANAADADGADTSLYDTNNDGNNNDNSSTTNNKKSSFKLSQFLKIRKKSILSSNTNDDNFSDISSISEMIQPPEMTLPR